MKPTDPAERFEVGAVFSAHATEQERTGDTSTVVLVVRSGRLGRRSPGIRFSAQSRRPVHDSATQAATPYAAVLL